MAVREEVERSLVNYAVAGLSSRDPLADHLNLLTDVWRHLAPQEAEYSRHFLKGLKDEEVTELAEFCADNLEVVPKIAESTFNLIQSAPGFRQSGIIVRSIYEQSLRVMVAAEREVMKRVRLNPQAEIDQESPEHVFQDLIASRRALQSVDEENVKGGTWQQRLEKARAGDKALWPETAGGEMFKECLEHMLNDRVAGVDLSKSFGCWLFIYTEKKPEGRWVYDAITDVTSRSFMNPPELDADRDFHERLVRATQQAAAQTDFWNAHAAALLKALDCEEILSKEFPYLFRTESGTQAFANALRVAQHTKRRLLLMEEMANNSGFGGRGDFEAFTRGKKADFEVLKKRAEREGKEVTDLIREEVDTQTRIAYQYLFSGDGSTNVHSDYFEWLMKENGLDDSRLASEEIVISGAFHGRTAEAITATRTPSKVKNRSSQAVPWVKRLAHPMDLDTPEAAELRRRDFYGELTDVERESFEEQMLVDLELYLKINHRNVAVVGVEAMQGEGGYRRFSDKFLFGLQELAQKYGVFFMVDEIQTGMGRASGGEGKDGGTGWFLWQKIGLKPDLFLGGKMFGEGEVYVGESFDRAIYHGLNRISGVVNCTFGGSPAGAVRLVASLPLMKEWLPRSKEMGELFMQQLRNMEQRFDERERVDSGKKLFGRVRGEGTMIAFDLANPDLRNRAVKLLAKNNLITLATGSNGIRFLPPYDIPEGAIYEILDIIERSLNEVRDEIEDKPTLFDFRSDVPDLDQVISPDPEEYLEAHNVRSIVGLDGVITQLPGHENYQVF